MATPATAHPVLLFTTPTLDTAVAESPQSVVLVFNEAVVVNTRAITITDLRGRDVPSGESRTAKAGTVVTAPVPETLPTGTYRVRWVATGVDGHGVDGEFRFAVGTAVTGAGTTSTGQATNWLAATFQWLLLAGFALAFGGLIAERFTASARAENPELPNLHPWSAYGAVLGLAAAAASGAMLVADAGIAASWRSTPGQVLLTDAAGFLIALVLIAMRRRLWALVPLAVVALAEGVRSHSNVELPATGALLTAVHLAAAALWAGALLHVARTVVAWRTRSAAIRWVLVSYARVAAWVFVVVVLSGLTMALLLVPLPALTTTAYGKTLLIKLVLVLIATGLAVAGRRALRRRPEVTGRSVRVESVTLVAVLAASAVLVSTPTPGATSAAPPPPPTRGVAVPGGGLAGQVGVNLVASDGQLVVRLSTPRRTDYIGP
ncbi:MAG: copper resistance CopC family protein, partial [Thermocrispum sp.]